MAWAKFTLGDRLKIARKVVEARAKGEDWAVLEKLYHRDRVSLWRYVQELHHLQQMQFRLTCKRSACAASAPDAA